MNLPKLWDKKVLMVSLANERAAAEAGVATVTGPISASPKPNVDRCEGLVAIARVLRNRFW